VIYILRLVPFYVEASLLNMDLEELKIIARQPFLKKYNSTIWTNSGIIKMSPKRDLLTFLTNIVKPYEPQ